MHSCSAKASQAVSMYSEKTPAVIAQNQFPQALPSAMSLICHRIVTSASNRSASRQKKYN
jgi:hypothetical protein